MYDNDVIIETVFVSFDLPKVDSTYCRDFMCYFVIIFYSILFFRYTIELHRQVTAVHVMIIYANM